MAEIAGEPRYAPMILADKTCGLVAANAISAALYARERTGRGQFVEVPMFETMAAFILTEHLFGHTFVPPEAPLGYPRVLAPVAPPLQDQGRPYLHARLYRPAVAEILDRGRQAGAGRRSALRNDGKPQPQHRGSLSDSPASASAAAPPTNGCRSSRSSKSPRPAIASLDDLMHDPHLEAVGLLKQATHPTEGEIMMTDLPVRFSDTRAAIERLQPKFGEHSVEILARSRALGRRDCETRRLRLPRSTGAAARPRAQARVIDTEGSLESCERSASAFTGTI